LRTGVYFSLGAGPTGLFALLTGVGGAASLAWSAGAGVFIAVLTRALRAFVRRDLDSSIKPEEFLMDQAVICVPVAPGAMGKALVSRYGRDTELYVRCKDQSRALQKGEVVRIVDMDDDCYWVEAHG
jgi:membrane protein implicated in regulation of membrane protease activity